MDGERKTVAVVGGKGKLGRRMAELFSALGHKVVITDLDTKLVPTEAASLSNVTLICVPISVTSEVIRRVGPHVPADGLLMDVTSIKAEPLRAMLAATRASVLGTHPMFGPAVKSWQGQRVVMCKGRGEAWAAWVRSCFRAHRMTITETSADEHDRAMAVVQVLNHFHTQVYGLALSRLGFSISDQLQFTSPGALLGLYMTARHFGLDPDLFGPLQMASPLLKEVTEVFRSAAENIQTALIERDREQFAAMFHEVREFFGDFTKSATVEAAQLMEHVVQHQGDSESCCVPVPRVGQAR